MNRMRAIGAAEKALQLLCEGSVSLTAFCKFQARLGNKFDIREFHDRILENGSMTLPMVEKAVMNWVEKNR